MASSEHTCILALRLIDQEDEAEETLLVPLVEELEVAVTEAEVGELDSEDFDGEWHRVVFIGPDADELHEVLESVLAHSLLSKDAKITKRYGSIDDPEAEEVELEY